MDDGGGAGAVRARLHPHHPDRIRRDRHGGRGRGDHPRHTPVQPDAGLDEAEFLRATMAASSWASGSRAGRAKAAAISTPLAASVARWGWCPSTITGCAAAARRTPPRSGAIARAHKPRWRAASLPIPAAPTCPAASPGPIISTPASTPRCCAVMPRARAWCGIEGKIASVARDAAGRIEHVALEGGHRERATSSSTVRAFARC